MHAIARASPRRLERGAGLVSCRSPTRLACRRSEARSWRPDSRRAALAAERQGGPGEGYEGAVPGRLEGERATVQARDPVQRWPARGRDAPAFGSGEADQEPGFALGRPVPSPAPPAPRPLHRSPLHRGPSARRPWPRPRCARAARAPRQQRLVPHDAAIGPGTTARGPAQLGARHQRGHHPGRPALRGPRSSASTAKAAGSISARRPSCSMQRAQALLGRRGRRPPRA